MQATWTMSRNRLTTIWPSTQRQGSRYDLLIAQYYHLKRMINIDLTMMMMIYGGKMINTFSARFVSSDQRSELV